MFETWETNETRQFEMQRVIGNIAETSRKQLLAGFPSSDVVKSAIASLKAEYEVRFNLTVDEVCFNLTISRGQCMVSLQLIPGVICLQKVLTRTESLSMIRWQF